MRGLRAAMTALLLAAPLPGATALAQGAVTQGAVTQGAVTQGVGTQGVGTQGVGTQGTTPAQQNATQGAGSQAAPKDTDQRGRADSLRTGVAEVDRTAPIPLSVEQERQAERIGTKLHCPICSGESIAQSQTDISRQMMNEVRDGIRQGQSESQILGRFVASYGERILMEPPKKGINWLLWGFPVGALVLGTGLWQGYLRRASREPVQTLSAEDERRIATLLREREDQA